MHNSKFRIQNPKKVIPLIALLAVVVLAFAQFMPAVFSQVQFADPAFRTAWERTDGPVAATAIERGWVWGPAPGRSLTEPFTGLPGDAHLVQYFDKGRMELNDPTAQKDDPF